MDYIKSLSEDQLIYTPYYCEENIWKLCEKIALEKCELIENCYVIFISNDREQTMLWGQKIGQENGTVNNYTIWDYHVIMAYLSNDNETLIFDFESLLPFPCSFDDYYKEVLNKSPVIIRQRPQYKCFFRVIKAKEYLQVFASDRSRMKNEEGDFIEPPPEYPCIQTSEDTNNLNKFISMDQKKFDIGEVMDLNDLKEKFAK